MYQSIYDTEIQRNVEQSNASLKKRTKLFMFLQQLWQWCFCRNNIANFNSPFGKHKL